MDARAKSTSKYTKRENERECNKHKTGTSTDGRFQKMLMQMFHMSFFGATSSNTRLITEPFADSYNYICFRGGCLKPSTHICCRSASRFPLENYSSQHPPREPRAAVLDLHGRRAAAFSPLHRVWETVKTPDKRFPTARLQRAANLPTLLS